MVIPRRTIGTTQIVTKVSRCDWYRQSISLLYYLIGHSLQNFLDVLFETTNSRLAAGIVVDECMDSLRMQVEVLLLDTRPVDGPTQQVALEDFLFFLVSVGVQVDFFHAI